MSSAAAEYPWRSQVFGEAVAAQRSRSALVLASYPLLLLLVILAAFVRYLWIALTMYSALLFVLSCAARTLSARPAAAEAARVRVSRGGLSATAIAAVAPAFQYKASAASSALGEPAAQCAVCLEGMKDGEATRRLPPCSHVFHVGCIDMWLDSHATCPVCRSHVVPPLPPKAGKQPPETLLVHPSPEPTLPPV
ncbi:RING-H2 finger protein ATL39-like [Miscanthus floridulus]|uniref:RING-H2 finger protein ATL39-like n=1 Tax=Miscanthus floridulus TaxID=154761 RepID=UPI003457CE9B